MIYATASLWRVDFQIHFLKKGGNLWKAPTELEQAVQETRHAVQSLPFGNFQCPSPLSHQTWIFARGLWARTETKAADRSGWTANDVLIMVSSTHWSIDLWWKQDLQAAFGDIVRRRGCESCIKTAAAVVIDYFGVKWWNVAAILYFDSSLLQNTSIGPNEFDSQMGYMLYKPQHHHGSACVSLASIWMRSSAYLSPPLTTKAGLQGEVE